MNLRPSGYEPEENALKPAENRHLTRPVTKWVTKMVVGHREAICLSAVFETSFLQTFHDIVLTNSRNDLFIILKRTDFCSLL